MQFQELCGYITYTIVVFQYSGQHYDLREMFFEKWVSTNDIEDRTRMLEK
jgi:hypothetical protein